MGLVKAIAFRSQMSSFLRTGVGEWGYRRSVVISGPHAFVDQAVSSAQQKVGRCACESIRNFKITYTYNPT